MRKKRRLVIFLLIIILVSCTYNKSLNIVRDNVQDIVRNLPLIDDFEVIVTIPEEFTYGQSPDICYYGRLFVVYGTSLQSETAIELYLAKLRAADWQILRDDSENKVWQLVRGENEWMAIGTLLGPMITSNDVYKEANKHYETEFLVTVEYMLPSVEPCR